MWSDLRYRLRSLFRRADVERELDDELRFHLEHEAEKLMRNGLSRDEAMRAARLAFGGVDRIKDDTRDAHGITLLEHIARDVRYALRGMAARPAFATVVIATLALGVGVNAAMFSILDRTLFRAPRYLIDPGSVSRVYLSWNAGDGRRVIRQRTEYPRFAHFVQWNRSLSQVAGFRYGILAVGEGEATRELPVAAITATFFDFFDARPVIGRFFVPDEDRPPAGARVAVLAYDYWQREHGGRRDVLGTTITIGATRYQVIGVAPRGFEGISDARAPAAFVPITAFASASRNNYYNRYNWSLLEVLVRRKAGVSEREATADLTNTFLRSWNAERRITSATLPPERPVAIAAPLPLARGPLAGPETRVAVLVGGVALAVLLIACANVANLLLARAMSRRREMAVRRAIGGSPRRLTQQVLTETLVLASLGTVAGLAGAQASAAGLARLLLDLDTSWSIVNDARTVVWAIAVTIAIALFAGMVPALHVARADLGDALRSKTRGDERRSRVRTALLLVQTAASVVLLVGAGLFVRSLLHVRSMPLGYDVDRLVMVDTHMRDVRLTPVERVALQERLENEARSIPGVQGVTFANIVPMRCCEQRSIFVPGMDSTSTLGRFLLQAGSPDYFATLGTRILRGRPLSAEDRAAAPRIAVVSEAMAKALWKGADPIGQCFRIDADTVPCTTVVGVAENTRANTLTEGDEMMFYMPIAQYVSAFGPPEQDTYLIRVRGRPEDAVEAVRARLQRVMPGSAYVTAQTLHSIVDPTMRSWSSGARMFLIFGTLALAIAAIGLYAVITFGVTQRTNEIGVRLALGARGVDVLSLVVGEGMVVTLAGLAIGAAVAFAAARRVAPLLFDESPADPAVYLTVAVTLVVVGILASVIPASRAARVDPNVALRTE